LRSNSSIEVFIEIYFLNVFFVGFKLFVVFLK